MQAEFSSQLRHILLIGPPASGKSTIALLISKALSLPYLDIEPFVIAEMEKRSIIGDLSDEVIDCALNAFCASLTESSILEIPYHDYASWFSVNPDFMRSVAFSAVIMAPLETLCERNLTRLYSIPELYVTRCYGSAKAISALWSARSDVNWALIDTEHLEPAMSAAIITDCVRRDSSQNLMKLEIAPDPTRPYLGGHLQSGVEWDENIVKWLIERFEIKLALDVGCGLGLSLDYFERLGVECWGMDGNPKITADPGRQTHRLIQVDFQNQWLKMPCRFDLVWCIEVLEHIPAKWENNVIQTIVRNAKNIVVISASPPGQSGYHHVNCKSREYWIERFEEEGLLHLDEGDNALARLDDSGPFGRNDIKENGIIFKVR